MQDQKKKSYYQKHKETIIQKQTERYNRIKDDLKKQYQGSYFICECGKQVSSFRKELHNASKYHQIRTYEIHEPSESNTLDVHTEFHSIM
jgi:RNA polymerase-binding transcription factor DksA